MAIRQQPGTVPPPQGVVPPKPRRPRRVGMGDAITAAIIAAFLAAGLAFAITYLLVTKPKLDDQSTQLTNQIAAVQLAISATRAREDARSDLYLATQIHSSFRDVAADERRADRAFAQGNALYRATPPQYDGAIPKYSHVISLLQVAAKRQLTELTGQERRAILTYDARHSIRAPRARALRVNARNRADRACPVCTLLLTVQG